MEKIKQALEATTLVRNAIYEAYIALFELEGSQPKAPPRYVRSGPPVQMQDVLLACGELNERERVAVRWVLDKINELPEHTKEQGAEPVAWMTEDGEVFSYQHPLATTPLYRAPTAREKAMEEAGDALAKLHTIGNVERWNAAKSTK